MGSFMIMTLLFILVFGTTLSYMPTGTAMNSYAPISKKVDPEKMNWEAIEKIGGRGIVVDEDGNVIKSYGGKSEKETYTTLELIGLFDLRGRDYTTFSYTTKDENKLLMIYPKSVFDTTLAMDVNNVMGKKSNVFPIILIVGLMVYLFGIYMIIARLSRRLKIELELIRMEKDEKENLFFRGLAHDIKTPLSTIIAYSKALEDGIVDEQEVRSYYHSIYNNGIVLKERVGDMLALTTLGDEGIFDPQEGDLLEDIRRFVGERYAWFVENEGIIHIEFEEQDKFVTQYDHKLVERLLENLLHNSIDHNQDEINIWIEWNNKSKMLTISDDGLGVPSHIRGHMWEPMVIGDESRTGEKLRGMGLANVRRIGELHGWEIEYDGKFKIVMN